MSDYAGAGLSRRTTASCSPHSFPTEAGLPKLPLETIEHIARFLFALDPPKDPSDATLSSKLPWAAVCGFMSASPTLHTIGFVLWVQRLKIIQPEDWDWDPRLPGLVLELDCRDGAFSTHTSKDILVRFKLLRAVRIDCHADVVRRQGDQFAYRNLFTSLPRSLLRLEIANAHGPDLKIIQTVRFHCPGLVVLRLGRCTMFNRVPACEFWSVFPLDHDAYIAAIGTDDFAHSVAQELVSLTRLKTLRIAVYFMHSTAVLAHRVYHMRGSAAPEPVTWQQAISDLHNIPIPPPPERPNRTPLVELYHQDAEPVFGPGSCKFCDQSLEPSRAAEDRANVVIKRLLPNLDTVEWMDWFSNSHLGVHQHSIKNLAIPESTVPP